MLLSPEILYRTRLFPMKTGERWISDNWKRSRTLSYTRFCSNDTERFFVARKNRGALFLSLFPSDPVDCAAARETAAQRIDVNLNCLIRLLGTPALNLISSHYTLRDVLPSSLFPAIGSAQSKVVGFVGTLSLPGAREKRKILEATGSRRCDCMIYERRQSKSFHILAGNNNFVLGNFAAFQIEAPLW